MPDQQPFSKRQSFFTIKPKEITIREDAPVGLRGFIRIAYYDLNKEPADLRLITTRVLKISPDKNNWSQYPNIDNEVEEHLDTCDWYLVYDIIEKIIKSLDAKERESFTNEINEYFVANGIGWKIEGELIEIRGDEVFETAVKKVVNVLETAKLDTAKAEIKEAINDLSRRPSPDITGAIQHSLACLECVTRSVTGDTKSTLGELMKKFPGVIPTPLDQAVTKIWGYTSEQGRHLQEGKAPEYLEAELVVEVTAAISTYLGKKSVQLSNNKEEDELAF